MLTTALWLAAAMLGAALVLNFYRLLRGPGLPDRILALDTLYINAIGLLVLLGIHTDSTAYFEVGVMIAALGFIGTVAAARYLLRGAVME